MNRIEPWAIYDVRILLEAYSAKRAAIYSTDEELQRMRSLLTKMEDRSISVNERRETDYEFHVAIAEAAQNPLNVVLVMAMRDVFIAMIEKGIFNQGGIEDACIRHGRILKALEAHDPEAAEAAMIDHVKYSLEQVTKYDKKEHENK